MLSYERRKAICDLVEKQGRADIAGMVELFGVSAETIRKDLILLEKNRKLKRVHGGVLPWGGQVHTLDLSERFDVCRDKKRELCRYALSLINDGDWIFLDAGSTTSELIEQLPGRFTDLNIVSYYAPVATQLGNEPGIKVYICGGRYDATEKVFCGNMTVEYLKQIKVDKAFICPSAISLENGATNTHYGFLEMMKAGAETSDRVYLLADSEKLEKNGHFKLFGLDRVEAIITDSGLDDSIFRLYSEKNIRIIRGPLK